jgi:hypothetical protein
VKESEKMTDKNGQNESHTFKGGEIVYLLKKPGRKWTIRFYECAQKIRYDVVAGGLIFELKQGIPEDWKKREFDTENDAISFVQAEIDSGRVPTNNK